MQAIFEISCVSTDPVTNPAVNSEVHSNPGKAQRRREIHSQVVVYIQLPGKKYMVCLPFLNIFKTNFHHHSQGKKNIYPEKVNERRHISTLALKL